MTITPSNLEAFVVDARTVIHKEEQRLNAADAKLGDGDTGSMLSRVLDAMAKSDTAETANLTDAAMGLAQAAMKETGSSLGTLIATASVALAHAAKSADGKIGAADMGRVVAEMRDSVAARGKAASGDKTVIDSLDAIAAALNVGPANRTTAAKAAADALDAFRDKPCRTGRARMFPQRSTGADDPGMLAIALVLNNATVTK